MERQNGIYRGPVRCSFVLCSAALAMVSSCGGGSSAPGARAPTEASEEEGMASEEPGSSSSSSEGQSEAPRCEDGTCSPCGDAVCPTGYYCDEGVSPAVCSWLPECAREPSCNCLTRRLGNACACEARDNGLYVKCE